MMMEGQYPTMASKVLSLNNNLKCLEYKQPNEFHYFEEENVKRSFTIMFVLFMLCCIPLSGCASQPAKTEAPAASAPTTAPVATSAPTEVAASVEAPTTPAIVAVTSAPATAFDPSTKTLGLVIWNKNVPVVQIMEAGFLYQAKNLGYKGELYAADQANLADAVALGETAIANHVDGLVIYLLDEGIKPLIKKAADAGIPVVTGHTSIENPNDWPGVKAWAAADPTAYAVEVAKAIGKQVNGKGTVAVSQGSFNLLENNVYKAFKDEMSKDYPDIKVLDAQEEGFDAAVAVSKATAIIQSNPDLVGAFSTTGGGAVAWSQAADQAGRKDLTIIGMDYSEQNLDLVKSGKVYAVVAQPTFEEHAYCAELLDKILRGEKVEFANLLPAPLVTKDNVDEYYAKIQIVKDAFSNK
jgi:ribose transport system substrate-binding protein